MSDIGKRVRVKGYEAIGVIRAYDAETTSYKVEFKSVGASMFDWIHMGDVVEYDTD